MNPYRRQSRNDGNIGVRETSKRILQDWDSTELKPTPKPLPMANIVKRCSAGDRLFGDRLVVGELHLGPTLLYDLSPDRL